MTTTTKLTLAEFLRLPETEPASEYEDGEVCRKPMPTVMHGVVQRLLSFVFTLYLRQLTQGLAGSEIRCVFGPAGRERAYVPDFVFVAGAPFSFSASNDAWRGPPDLAVEILSPDDRMTRVRRKVRFYLQNGVRIVWIIDPEDRTLTAITDPSEWLSFGEDEWIDGGKVASGFRVQVRDILPPVVAATEPQQS